MPASRHQDRRVTIVDIQEMLEQNQKWSIGPDANVAPSGAFGLGHVLLDGQPDPKDISHYHENTEEGYLVLGGWMEIQIGPELVRIEPNQFLRILPGQENVHIIKSVGPKTILLLFKAPSIPGDKYEHPLPELKS